MKEKENNEFERTSDVTNCIKCPKCWFFLLFLFFFSSKMEKNMRKNREK